MVKDDRKETYQDSVTAPLSRGHDSDAGDVDGLEEATLGQVLTAIPKVDFIFGLHILDSELTCAS